MNINDASAIVPNSIKKKKVRSFGLVRSSTNSHHVAKPIMNVIEIPMFYYEYVPKNRSQVFDEFGCDCLFVQVLFCYKLMRLCV